MIRVPITLPARGSSYTISIGGGDLAGTGKCVRRWLGNDARQAFVVSNPTVAGLYGEAVAASLAESGFDVSTFLIKDGERYKTLRTAESALAAFSSAGLTRTDAVIALGGGVVGDLAGFAAAIYLRGIRFIQVPTTLLAMIDSSVGGKTGVNTAFGKNLTGAFHQPSGVLIDPNVLSTLPSRELTAGFCEMVKHGALAGRELLQQTDEVLTRFGKGPAVGMERSMSALIKSNVEFKASIAWFSRWS